MPIALLAGIEAGEPHAPDYDLAALFAEGVAAELRAMEAFVREDFNNGGHPADE